MGTDVEVAPSGTPAPYGKACTNCARAKCRCIYRIEGHTCERCHRLRKECKPSLSTRRRNGTRVPSSRTAQLEEKLDDLVSLLRNQTGNAVPPNSAPETAPAPDLGIGTPSPSQSEQSPCAPDSHPAAVTVGNTHLAPATPSSIITGVYHPIISGRPLLPPYDESSILTSPYEPDAVEAEQCLATFRENMLSFFPFLYLPDDLTAKQLREKNPFLWFNIMTITAKPVDPQLFLGDAVKRFISHKLVVQHERSLDMLLGLLVFTSWSHYHRKDRPCITIMMMLIKSLIYELGLNRHTQSEPTTAMWLKPSEPAKKQSQKERTAEERRAVLGSFYLTTQIALTFKKIEPLGWNTHMEDCLQFISQHPEWAGDEQLAAQIKIQLIVDQLNRNSWQSHEYGPPTLFLSALQSQLRMVKKQLPPRLEQNEIIAGQLLYTELIIQDAGISKTLGSPNHPDFQRHELLAAHLETIKAWFDNFFGLPAACYLGMTFAYWCHMAHSLMSLCRLTMLEDPAWDRRAVCERLDLFAVLDRLTADFTKVGASRRALAGARGEEDLFLKCARMMVSIRAGWMAEVQVLDQKSAGLPGGVGGGRGSGVGGEGGSGTGIRAGGGTNIAGTSATPSERFVDGVTGPLAVPVMLHDDAWLTDIINVSWWE